MCHVVVERNTTVIKRNTQTVINLKVFDVCLCEGVRVRTCECLLYYVT